MEKKKNKTRLARAAMTLLFALLATVGAWAQTTTVTIGKGTDTQFTLPINMYYHYSLTQQIYTADEIGMAGTITSISFDYANSESFSMEGVQLYMKNVNKENFESNADMVQISAGDKVWEGTFEASGAGWVTIDLITPFAYDGQSNLLVCFYDPTSGFPGPAYTFHTTATDDNLAISYYSDNGTPSLTDVSTFSGSKNHFQYRANIQLGITPGSGPTCDRPSTFEVSDITTSDAVFEWENTGAESYTFEYRKASESEWTVVSGLSSNTYSLSSLMPGTAYRARVKAVCGTDSESGYKSVSFTTMLPIPLVEGFATSSIPLGWNRYSGLLSNVQNGDATLSATTSSVWIFGTKNGVFDSHARVNIFDTSCQNWLVTPSLLMENNVELTFDLALTASYGTLQAPQTTGTDDKFVVLITTDGGTTWEVLRQWDNAGSEYVYNDIACSAVGQNVSIDLSSYAGQNIAIAFYAESTEYNAVNSLHIDNVSIDYIPDCAKPTGLAVSNVTVREATITWTSDANAWQVQLGDNDAVDVTDKTYTFTGLAPETAYSVKVRTDCGETYSNWTNPVSFTTTAACPAPTVTVSDITTTTAVVSCTNTEADQFNVMLGEEVVALNVAMPYTLNGLTANTTYTVKVQAVCGGEDGESSYSNGTTFTTVEECPEGKICIGTGTDTSFNVPANNGFNYSLTEQIYTADEIGEAGAIFSIDFYKASTYEMVKDLDIYIVSTTKDEFTSNADWIPVTASDLVYHGTVTFANNDWTTIELDNPFVYDGTSNIAIMVDNNTGSSVATTRFYTFNTSKKQAIHNYDNMYNDDPFAISYGISQTSKNRVRFAIGEPPACSKPIGVTVNYEGGTTATVTWIGEAESYNIDVNGTVTYGVTSPYTLTDLKLDATYQVKVQAVCSESAQSEWTKPFSFTTDMCMPEDICPIKITLTSSWGDGWLDSKLEVVDASTNVVLGTYSGYEGTFTLRVCNGRTINFVYTQGSFASQNGWVITDIDNEVIAEHEGCESGCEVDGGIIATYTVTSCRKPTDLAASEIAPHSAKLSWTENGKATAWVVAYKKSDAASFTETDASTNPFKLEGLDAETAYTVKVAPECEVEKWSDEITFTTPSAAEILFAKKGYATYYNSKKDVVLTAGMKAHIVTDGGTTLTYAEVADGDTDGNVVPAGTAVLLQVAPSTEDQTLSVSLVTPSPAASEVMNNFLFGSDVETTTGENDGTKYYKLTYSNNNDNFGWYWGAANGGAFTSPAHKAWLALPASSARSFLGLHDWQDATGIAPVSIDFENGEWYTLQGLKIGKKPTTAGVYIHNGRKVVVK